MKLTAKQIVQISILAILGGIIYLGRDILTPFILAAICAYLLDPIVNFWVVKLRIRRELSIGLTYILILSLLIFAGTYLGQYLITQIKDFASEARYYLANIERGGQMAELPSWLNTYIPDLLISLRRSINISSQQAIKIFSGALESLTSVFIFFLSLFYFLKEGHYFMEYFENTFSANSRPQFQALTKKINLVLGNYLRAQSFLVLIMFVVNFLVFSILGAKYAFIIGLIAGFAEIIPIIGPTIAFTAVILISGVSEGLGLITLPIFSEIILSGLIYVLINQLENILVVPQITGKMVSLHPLLILASVLIGGHLFGAMGFLLAVPLVASAKVILNHVLDLLE